MLQYIYIHTYVGCQIVSQGWQTINAVYICEESWQPVDYVASIVLGWQGNKS